MSLKEYFEKHGLKKGFFASKVKINPSYLSKLIKREVTPSFSLAIEIEKATNGEVTLYDFVP